MSNPTSGGSRKVWILVGCVLAFIALNLLITGLRGFPSNVPPVTLDENTGVPPVPTNADFPYDRTNNVVAIVLLGALGFAGLMLSLRALVKQRDLMPLMISLGTVLVVVPEVFVDVIGMVYYPTDEADNAFTLFGRQMGFFILAGWFGAGFFASTMIKVLLTRPTAKQVWILMAVTGLSYTIFEELLVGFGGIYHYYGNQPMWWNSLPLWWTPCNAIGCALLPAAFAYRYREHLQGWRAGAMLVVVPASVAGTYAFIGMPSWIVVNGDYPWLPTQLAGLSTWALGIGLIAIIMNMFLGYRPFDMLSRPEDSVPWGAPVTVDSVPDQRPAALPVDR